MLKNFYDILRISPQAEEELIHSAYRTLLSTLKKHPDLGGDTLEAAAINEAYETLSDPVKRARYDETLKLKKNTDVANEKPVEERRRAPRHDIDATVSYCLEHDLKWYPARVRDASILGIKLQSHAPIAANQHIVIAVSNLATPAVHGTVKWVRMFHPNFFERVYEAGIEFADQISDIDVRLSV